MPEPLDSIGRELSVGDYVAFTQPSRRRTVIGRVMRITDHMVSIHHEIEGIKREWAEKYPASRKGFAHTTIEFDRVIRLPINKKECQKAYKEAIAYERELELSTREEE